MKCIVISFLFVATLLSANAQSITDPVKYNDYIVEQQSLIGEKMLAFTGKFSEENMTLAVITPILEDLLSTAKKGVSAVKQLTPFEGDTQLKQSAIDLFQFYVAIIDREYREMVNLVFGDNLNDVAIEQIQELVQKITADEAVYDGNFSAAQAAYAAKYGFILDKNKLQDEIDKNWVGIWLIFTACEESSPSQALVQASSSANCLASQRSPEDPV